MKVPWLGTSKHESEYKDSVKEGAESKTRLEYASPWMVQAYCEVGRLELMVNISVAANIMRPH